MSISFFSRKNLGFQYLKNPDFRNIARPVFGGPLRIQGKIKKVRKQNEGEGVKTRFSTVILKMTVFCQLMVEKTFLLPQNK